MHDSPQTCQAGQRFGMLLVYLWGSCASYLVRALACSIASYSMQLRGSCRKSASHTKLGCRLVCCRPDETYGMWCCCEHVHVSVQQQKPACGVLLVYLSRSCVAYLVTACSVIRIARGCNYSMRQRVSVTAGCKHNRLGSLQASFIPHEDAAAAVACGVAVCMWLSVQLQKPAARGTQTQGTAAQTCPHATSFQPFAMVVSICAWGCYCR
jgi:hypothetical protein